LTAGSSPFTWQRERASLAETGAGQGVKAHPLGSVLLEFRLSHLVDSLPDHTTTIRISPQMQRTKPVLAKMIALALTEQ